MNVYRVTNTNNVGMWALAKNTDQAKHIALQRHYIRKVKNGLASLCIDLVSHPEIQFFVNKGLSGQLFRMGYSTKGESPWTPTNTMQWVLCDGDFYYDPSGNKAKSASELPGPK